jgi:hypothetical protein
MTDRSFKFTEEANSPDLTDGEVASAIPTGSADDIARGLTDQVCAVCGKMLGVLKHEKRFRHPHLYWRSLMRCPDGHTDQRVFQVTWLFKA